MDERELKELKGLLAEAGGQLRQLETLMREFVRKETRILEIVSEDVFSERSLSRGVDETRQMLQALMDHNFLRRVGRLVSDFERQVRDDQRTVQEVRDDLEDALVQVGDTEMTLGALLRALENAE